MQKKPLSQARLDYLETYRFMRSSERSLEFEFAYSDDEIEFLRMKLECIVESGLPVRGKVSAAPLPIQAAAYAYCHRSVIGDTRSGRFLAKQKRRSVSAVREAPVQDEGLPVSVFPRSDIESARIVRGTRS